MRLPFLHKFTVKKITGDASGIERQKAEVLLTAILRELPELLAMAVVEVQSGKTMAAYTATALLDPYKLNSRYAANIRQTRQFLTQPWLSDQNLTDFVLLLEDQQHCLRLASDGRWLCYVVVRIADANLALVREVMRRCTA
ncbi:hypothetical protein ACFPAF_02705 [Hymenobacter endophyticus]|uniref:Roadblock/LAMTOR2 domain-containing protein n=1 Tax=Hymenobacter endophyticus TaxID=3076335 RepID=A0ABU3TD47_9BACT|nr:hypothetical protein [Hymenobacter endophyticus]MDU0369293.1 hypothetical protein [Hymenobacter endophyticus]